MPIDYLKRIYNRFAGGSTPTEPKPFTRTEYQGKPITRGNLSVADSIMIDDKIGNIEHAYTEFRNKPNLDGKTMNRNLAIGLLGNIGVESKFDPTAKQGRGDHGLGYMQWTKKNNDWKNIVKEYPDPESREAQVDYIIRQMQGQNQNMMDQLDKQGQDTMRQMFQDSWGAAPDGKGVRAKLFNDDKMSVEEMTVLLRRNLLRPGVHHDQRRMDIATYLEKLINE